MIQLKAATVVNIFHLLAVVESQAVGESQETDYRLLYIQNISYLFTTLSLDWAYLDPLLDSIRLGAFSETGVMMMVTIMMILTRNTLTASLSHPSQEPKSKRVVIL